MRFLFLAALVATTFTACSTGKTVDGADSDVDTDSTTDQGAGDTDVTDTDTGGVDDTDVAVPPYTGGQYKVTELRVLSADHGGDLDGDGTPDNQIAVLLAAIDSALGPGIYNLPTVNARIDEMLFTERAIVLLDVDNDAGAVTFDALQGGRDLAFNLIVLPSSYDVNGDPKSRMLGEMKDPDTFSVGPAPLTIPVQFYADEPVIEISAVQAYIFGDITADTVDGSIAAAVTTTAIMEGVVKPLIESEFGLSSSYGQQFLGVAQYLVDQNADLTIDGEPALSAAFSFKAEDVLWTR